jgi:hypothetical protein
LSARRLFGGEGRGGGVGLVFAEFAVEGAGGDAEDDGRALAVAARLAENAEDVLAL